MAIVETRKLTKIFKRGNVGAVNNVDLQSREGEFLVLLGPSGSGKTTLLRMIAGLEEPTSGDILIGGKVVNDLTPRELLTFAPLVIIAFWIGLYPKPFFQILEQPVNQIVYTVRGKDYPGVQNVNAAIRPADEAADAAAVQTALNQAKGTK